MANAQNTHKAVDRPAFIDALEAEAYEQLALITAMRLAGRKTPEDRADAKTAMGVMGGYIRFRATLANEKSNELVEKRLTISEVPRRSLTA